MNSMKTMKYIYHTQLLCCHLGLSFSAVQPKERHQGVKKNYRVCAAKVKLCKLKHIQKGPECMFACELVLEQDQCWFGLSELEQVKHSQRERSCDTTTELPSQNSRFRLSHSTSSLIEATGQSVSLMLHHMTQAPAKWFSMAIRMLVLLHHMFFLPVHKPAWWAGPFSLTFFTKMVSMGSRRSFWYPEW